VRGTELDIVQLWSFDSALYTAVLGMFAQLQKASIAFIMSVCLSASIITFPTGWIDVKFELRAFMKIGRKNPKLIKMGHQRVFE